MKRFVVIVGAGPAGLAAGLELVKNGFAVTILEREDMIGGIAKTIQYKGFRFDVGGHRFFTKNKEVNQLWVETLGKDFRRTPRLSRIYYDNKYFKYPIELLDTLRNVGFFVSLTCVASFLRYKVFPIKPEVSFSDWTTNRFGKKLFEMFFKSYTEKVWGISTDKLSAEWAAQRIKGLSLWKAVKHSLLKRQTRVKSFIDEFKYPKHGPGMMYEKMAEKIESLGGKILLGHQVTSFKVKEDKVIGVEAINLKNGKRIKSSPDYIISTMPLPQTIKSLSPRVVALNNIEKKLKFRDFLSVNLVVKKSHVFPDTWIYIHDSRVKMGRIQNFKNWSEYMTSDKLLTPVGCEYFCNQGDRLWSMKDQSLIELAKSELELMNLVKKEEVIDGNVYRMRDAYPVYMGSYQKLIGSARAVLEKYSNLQVAGRGGMFRYNNMDHSILAGLSAARNITGRHYNLWAINEEKEYCEES